MTIRGSQSALLVCTAMALISGHSTGHAQDADAQNGTTVLERITIKGKRVKAGDAVSDTPLATQTTAEEIAKKEVADFRDLGNTTEAGLDFIRGQGVYLRGLGGSRVVTLIDGIPIPYLQNTARNGGGGPTATTNADGGIDSFDFSALSAVDVVRGADSSRAGSGAIAGAVVLRTLEPKDIITEGRNWGGVAKVIYDSEDNSIGGNVAVAKKIENTSILFQGGYKRGHEKSNQGDVDTIGAARTKANPADFYQRSVMFKARQDIEGGHRIGFTTEHFDRDSTADLKTVRGATSGSSRGYSTRWGTDDVKRDRVSLDYEYEAPTIDGLIDTANLSLYWQRLTKNAGEYGYRLASPAIGSWLRDNELKETDIGITGNLSSSFEAGSVSHKVSIGGNFSVFRAEQYLAGEDFCVLNPATPGCSNLHSNQADMPRVDGIRLGLYADDKIEFGTTGFSLTPGVRFDWYDYNTKLTPEYAINPGYAQEGLPPGSDGMRLSPKLLASYQLAPEVELFAQWSMAYRAPTVNELYLNFSNPSSGYGVLGNSDLKPEIGQGFEIGTNLGDDDFGGRITAYHNRYRNFIDTVTLTGVPGYPAFLQTNFNRDRVSISGFEASVQKRFDGGFNVHGSLAYAYGKDTEANEVIRTVAPFKAIAGIGYEQEKWGVDFTGIFASAMRDDHKATTFDAAGYGIFNLSGWWEPEQTKGLRIQAGIYNIFDRTYYDALALRDVNPATVPSNANAVQSIDYYSEPGRTFKISLTQKF
ncbi:TonB-dependent hemoglobin/transferrin/lactoferrin family receptor [Agrobacterium rosae]|uniref:Putative hemoglobin and hemoglobin-haptoglobin-binding protein 2 n=1 Tax=Agrobacterium rosae TaxID=1972867 RepID=A0A1R3TDF9_9HYPH|nr:TonB-dependent hemoglobin/transferrin/lactoferrin family receptor [Agrobacterium rosae]SCX06014.1 putative hemoglobin and hemoglobin-haptoglobin-binding protein 2 precursor [Agrobacterium rosae]